MRSKTTPPSLIRLLTLGFCVLLINSLVAAAPTRQSTTRQKLQPAPGTFPAVSHPQTKRIITWRRREASNGQRFILTADASLEDYSSYVEGDRLIVRIGQATLAKPDRSSDGHGYADVMLEEHDATVVVSVRIVQGSTVSVSQNFNRVEISYEIERQGKD